MQLYCLRLGRLIEEGKLTDTIAAIAKMNNTRKARQVIAEARDLLGGWPGEQPCSHSTLPRGPPKTSTSSPPRSAATSPPHATPWRPQPASAAGPPSGSMTAARSAGWSSAALTPGSWSTWP
jgi:hypothetical protein